MRILIIEDELLTARELSRAIVNAVKNADILPIIRSVEDALLFFENSPTVDLIFSDIELSDGLSFEIFERYKITTPIIFCTAYEQYAIKVFETSGIDYILKPFNAERIEKALVKYDIIHSKKIDYSDAINNLKGYYTTEHNNNITSIITYEADRIIPIPLKQIAFFYIKDKSVNAHQFDGKEVYINQSLDNLESQLPKDYFRANREIILNRKVVIGAREYFHRKLLVELSIPAPFKVIVSKLRKTDFLNWLKSY